jgi:hypothetical protein
VNAIGGAACAISLISLSDTEPRGSAPRGIARSASRPSRSAAALRRPGRSSAQHAVHRASNRRAVPHGAPRSSAAAAARRRPRAARRARQAAACAHSCRIPPQPPSGRRRAHPRRCRVACRGRRRVPRPCRSALPLAKLATRLRGARGRLTRLRCRSLPLPPAAAGASIIDGKAIAETVRGEVTEKVARMKAATGKARGRRPGAAAATAC